MKNIKKSILLAGAVLLFLTTHAQKEEDAVEVRGVASLKAVPEIARLQIPISVEVTDYKECSDSLMRKLSALQEELYEIGVPEEQLKSTGFSIEEHFEYNKKRQKVGYRGRANLEIKDCYHSSRLKEILKILRTNEANYTLSFVLSEEQKKGLTAELIALCVKDALEKAQMLTKASQIILGEILKITYQGEQMYGGDQFLLQEEEQSIADAPIYSVVQQLDLTPKELSVRRSVLIRWAIDY